MEIQLFLLFGKYTVSPSNTYLYIFPNSTNTTMRKKWTDEIQGTYCIEFDHKFRKNILKVWNYHKHQGIESDLKYIHPDNILIKEVLF